jgi:hypothetical protein
MDHFSAHLLIPTNILQYSQVSVLSALHYKSISLLGQFSSTINFYTFQLRYQSLLLFIEHKERVSVSSLRCGRYIFSIYICIYTVFWRTNYQEMYYSIQDTESMQAYYVLEKIFDFRKPAFKCILYT